MLADHVRKGEAVFHCSYVKVHLVVLVLLLGDIVKI